MKKIIQILMLSLLSLGAFAQTTILNGNFANWNNVGSSTAAPQYWNSNMDGGGNASEGGETLFQSTTAYTNCTYSAQVTTESILFGAIIVNGSLTTGEVEAPSTSKADGYIWSEYGNSQYFMSFVGRPDSLVFWYQYTSKGGDSATVQARLHVGNCYVPETASTYHPDSSVNIIARALFTSNPVSVSTWTRVSVPFVYVDGRTPQGILITATPSSVNTGGTAGSSMLLDSMTVIYNPKINTDSVAIVTYYVSATSGSSASVPFTLINTFNSGNVVTAQLSNASGSFASPVDIGTSTTTSSGTIAATIPANTASGTGYRIRVVSSNPVLTATDNGSNISITLVNTSVAPDTTQNIQVNTNGSAITVTETPAATSRQWEYSSTSGGPYQDFQTSQTDTGYTPNFGLPGVYYVVCVSTYPGSLNDTSNQVQVNVDSNSIAPGTGISTSAITGSPFLVSLHANVPVSVNFTSVAVFGTGNIFTAQLSDNTGSFASAVNIGTLNGTSIGTISAVIPDASVSGTQYRIRVISSNPAITGSDNGTDLTINKFSNSVSPDAAQTILFNTNGTALTVNPSQTGSQQWKYSVTSGSGYLSFSPAQTANTYTPNFAVPDTYYVVCTSTNQWSDSVTSNEVEIIVSNGSEISTSAVSGSPYYISDSADDQVPVNFTSDAVFSAGNIFTAQLSDQNGSFATPVNTGNYAGTNISAITATIPNNSVGGTHYRIRVVSSTPAITGSDNGTDLTIIPFTISVAPADTQVLAPNQSGAALVISVTQPVTAYDWQFSRLSGIAYGEFYPPQNGDTLVPQFSDTGTYYIICNVTNFQHATGQSAQVAIIVTKVTGITGISASYIKAYWDNNDFIADLSAADLISPVIELADVTGRIVVQQKIAPLSINRIPTSLPEGFYMFRITDGEQVYTGKTAKR